MPILPIKAAWGDWNGVPSGLKYDALYPTSDLPFGPLELGYAGQPTLMVPVAEIVNLLELPIRSIPVSKKSFLGSYIKVVDGGYAPYKQYHLYVTSFLFDVTDIVMALLFNCTL